jgi:hypothetical protein
MAMGWLDERFFPGGEFFLELTGDGGFGVKEIPCFAGVG